LLTVWSSSIVHTVACPVVPPRRAAVVPAGLGGRLGPAPHAGVEAAGAGLLLERARRGRAEVRRGVVFIHAALLKVSLLFSSAVKSCWSRSEFVTTQLSHVYTQVRHFRQSRNALTPESSQTTEKSRTAAKMLVLFETAAGYAIFKVLDESKLQQVDSLYKEFETPEKANKVVKLKHFEKFQDTTEALAAATALVEGKIGKSLKKVLKKVVAKEAHEQLAISDVKLGGVIKEKLDVSCVHSPAVAELMRCIRGQMENLITGLPPREISAMSLGLAHSLSRYKLKFSPDKVDTMIVQAISLLDDLDKELNNYIMRCREWYGWHFPELGKVITDNLAYCKTVRKIGDRTNVAGSDLSDLLPEEIEAEVKLAAEISMGTEVSEQDINNIRHLCDQVVEISEYRTQLYDYLKNRMMAIAPNLTVMVGELVGARLISHAGSLLNLAKHPASTVQILGAEKALFRALKTRKDTPKYGLIYHASLVGQTTAKNKGKISRMLAAKAALAIRYDALGEDTNAEMGVENRAKLEARLRQLEEKGIRRISGSGKAMAKADKYQHKSEVRIYDPSGDSTIPSTSKKRKFEELKGEESAEEPETPVVKSKKPKKEPVAEEEEAAEETPKKKKKKKDKKAEAEPEEPKDEEEEVTVTESTEKKKKKKKKKEEQIHRGRHFFCGPHSPHPLREQRTLMSACSLWISPLRLIQFIPQTLVQKLTTLGLSSTLCNWVLDFLTDRPQSVRIHDVSSSSISLSTGSPQGCVLSPLLFTLLTHDCSAIHPSCLIVKFADDTAVVGRIANNDESDYRQEVEAPGGLVQTKQPLHQREEDQGDDRGLQKGQTPPLSPVHRRDCGGSGLQLQEAEARRAGELSPDLLLQMCGGERPVLLHHRVARQLLGGREEGSAEGGEGCTEDSGTQSTPPPCRKRASCIMKDPTHTAHA
ncbi:hypothetical protein L3Q82_009854, partial [Scortum barcoo]